MAEELLKLATDPIPAKVVVAIPEIEAWFFAVPESIERVLRGKVPPNVVPLGKRDPKGILDWLAQKSKKSGHMNQAIRGLGAAGPTLPPLRGFPSSIAAHLR